MYHAENISIIYYGPFQPKVPCYLHFLCITVLHLWIQPTVGREVLYLLGENPCTHTFISKGKNSHCGAVQFIKYFRSSMWFLMVW